MNAIRIVKQLDSDRLPELAPLLGKKVEIIVLEESSFPPPQGKTSAAFAATAGSIDVDEEAIRDLKKASLT